MAAALAQSSLAGSSRVSVLLLLLASRHQAGHRPLIESWAVGPAAEAPTGPTATLQDLPQLFR